jgi:hypothetical protein
MLDAVKFNLKFICTDCAISSIYMLDIASFLWIFDWCSTIPAYKSCCFICIQCWTSKLDKFVSAVNRFFLGEIDIRIMLREVKYVQKHTLLTFPMVFKFWSNFGPNFYYYMPLYWPVITSIDIIDAVKRDMPPLAADQPSCCPALTKNEGDIYVSLHPFPQGLDHQRIVSWQNKAESNGLPRKIQYLATFTIPQQWSNSNTLTCYFVNCFFYLFFISYFPLSSIPLYGYKYIPYEVHA